jgi:ABC-2 type transport system ATP-binding protein
MSNQEPAIIVKNLYKSFKLPHEQHSGIKQRIFNVFKGVKGYEIQKVLDDVSFEIKKGEFFGIVGRNGSGKSTLLKLLASIYIPDKGMVKVNGSLTPFIELGVGFNPELTGRENVFLNGALLGFSKKEMEFMYDDIVRFAEIEKFMDQKLKNYSSGMQVRLAFSIAIRAKSDILVLDEVLAVGDEAFQKKCTDYFYSIKKSDQTVILVTHDMGNVERFCDRALVLNGNKVMGIFEPAEAKMIYNQLNRDTDVNSGKEFVAEKRWGSKKAEIKSIKINKSSKNNVLVKQGESFTIDMTLTSDLHEKIILGLAIYDDNGVVISGPNSEKYTFYTTDEVSYTVSLFPLNPGSYNVRAILYAADNTEEYDHIEDALKFEVIASGESSYHGEVNLFGKWKSVNKESRD